jgi:hypothetical protein
MGAWFDIGIRGLLFCAGLLLVGFTLMSAVQTFVLPRAAQDPLVKLVFTLVFKLFHLRLHFTHTFQQREQVMAFYAPLSLMALLPAWYVLVMLGYTLMYRAFGATTWYLAFRDSGSSLLTLGFETVNSFLFSALAFSEAMIGLILVALLLAYLPTMYSAFSRRESLVTMLEVRAGDPPSAIEMIIRFYRIQGLSRLTEMWRRWEEWFADIEESHTSLAALVFFRSPQPGHSWVTAAGTVLDAAALTLAVIDIPNDAQAALCIRAGYLALRRIADFFNVQYPLKPAPDDPISIRRDEFDEVCAELERQAVPLKADRDQAWRDYAGWRVNYDTTLLALAQITMAPRAMWVSDRTAENAQAYPFSRNRSKPA